MQATDALKLGLTSTQNLVAWYIGDLTDQEITVRPVPNANNIAWQMGHLIEGEYHLGSDLPGATYPELPGSIKGQYDKKTASTAPRPVATSDQKRNTSNCSTRSGPPRSPMSTNSATPIWTSPTPAAWPSSPHSMPT